MEHRLTHGFVEAVTTFSNELRAELRAHAERAFPSECVGALLGTGAQVLFTRALENVAAEPRAHFEVSAREYLALEREAEARQVSVRGFYHSHPHGPATPSAEDAMHALHGQVMVIIPVFDGVAAELHSFRFEGASP